MNALVVYESLSGNTAAIGEAVASSLRASGFEVTKGLVSKVNAAEAGEVDLLVVGGPTHVHGMTSATSRKTTASDQKNGFPEPTLDAGLRDWLKELPPGMGRLAAAFDTRIDKPVVFTGSAAKGIGHRLKGRGYWLVAQPQSFFVSGDNRLLEHELERAESWARDVADGATERVALANGR
jgi:hypothetical protein